MGSLVFPVLADVPVFMPVPFEVNPGDACLVVFADNSLDDGAVSRRKHSLSDGFAFVGFRSKKNMIEGVNIEDKLADLERRIETLEGGSA